MKKLLKFTTAAILVFQTHSSYANYICYYLINTEIQNSLQEHEKQKSMRNRQLGNLSSENANRGTWTQFQATTEKIKSRLNGVSLAIQAIPTSASIVREINKIYSIQDDIYTELEDAPIWIPTALQGQYEFTEMLQMNIRLMTGIVLSYGTINQMEKSERKILLDYAANEMKSLRILSWQTLTKIRIAKRKLKVRQGMLASWINRDKQLVNEILRNARNL